jgi:hypothetical protein
MDCYILWLKIIEKGLFGELIMARKSGYGGIIGCIAPHILKPLPPIQTDESEEFYLAQ